jgi:hypothetical protein
MDKGHYQFAVTSLLSRRDLMSKIKKVTGSDEEDKKVGRMSNISMTQFKEFSGVVTFHRFRFETFGSGNLFGPSFVGKVAAESDRTELRVWAIRDKCSIWLSGMAAGLVGIIGYSNLPSQWSLNLIGGIAAAAAAYYLIPHIFFWPEVRKGEQVLRKIAGESLNTPQSVKSESWICTKCNLEVEAEFDQCWKCGRANVDS